MHFLEDKVTKTCFIVEELFPRDKGGIGRLMHNIFLYSHAVQPTAEIHVVLTCQQSENTDELVEFFKDNVTFHFVDSDKNIANRIGIEALQSAISTRTLKEPFLKGLQILDAVLLAEISSGGPFDHLEIPDHMGLGAVVLSAKRAGLAFENTEITCRIHSTLSAIISNEPFYHERSDWLAPRLEMERYSLYNADRIISHLPPVGPFNKTHFDFPDPWLEKVETAFPPAVWPLSSKKPSPTDPDADFIFTSRFQPFKRPELFIRAAIALLESPSDFKGNFRLISYGFDQSYIDNLWLLIPDHLRNRIKIELNLPNAERELAINSGITVHSSAFESLCALAFEISSAGRPILLARDCAAFGNFERWQDGKNCLMFEPTPASLADVMEKARGWQPGTTVNTKPDSLYFHKSAKTAKTHASNAKATLLVGPLLTQQEFDIFATLDFGSTPVFGFSTPEHIAQFCPVENPDIFEIAASDTQGRQLGQIAARMQCCVIFASPNALPSNAFIQAGLLTVQPGIVFSSNSKTPTGQFNIYPGNMPTILASDYRMSPLCFMIHHDDTSIIHADDDRNVLPRCLARIAHSELDMVLHPHPLITETSPLIDQLPLRRLLGFDGGNAWKNNVQQIGIDVKSAAFSELLHLQPISSQTKNKPTRLRPNGKEPLTVISRPMLACSGKIMAGKVKNIDPGTLATVSLHQTGPVEAVAQHLAGINCRKIRGGQAYQMRWGPLRSNDPSTLVVTSDQETTLEIDQFFVISRE